MGVRVEVWREGRKALNVTPGWRSAFWAMLLDNGLNGCLDERDIPRLEEVRDTQRKGVERPPFDWSQDTANSFDKIIAAIRESGTVIVTAQH